MTPPGPPDSKLESDIAQTLKTNMGNVFSISKVNFEVEHGKCFFHFDLSQNRSLNFESGGPGGLFRDSF